MEPLYVWHVELSISSFESNFQDTNYHCDTLASAVQLYSWFLQHRASDVFVFVAEMTEIVVNFYILTSVKVFNLFCKRSISRCMFCVSFFAIHADKSGSRGLSRFNREHLTVRSLPPRLHSMKVSFLIKELSHKIFFIT
jgi:hypothetical protein